ncbi:serine/threonine protein kinase [Actinocatenispora rupis]|uniref:serine/threonine protein kinase n=1 Tax=Actinocatenispora rupis TaxID=519421 RepID=UPI0019444B82|nr:serine/threonine-protein kinase [Actinocatenispora rupis]
MKPLGPNDPEQIGPYRVLAELGRGGMGRVFLAAAADGTLVAVKQVREQLTDDEGFRARFSREVAASRQVAGEYTAGVLAADPDAPIPWLASEFVAGPSLHDALATGPFPVESVLALAAALSSALVDIHDAQLVHRDLKPSNVLLTDQGATVIDFGIARAADGAGTELTHTGWLVGAPGFMSPEQAMGQPVTGPSDVFSLGTVLLVAATGANPFDGPSTPQTLFNVVYSAPELDALPDQLRDLVECCLAKEPADRPTPAEVRDAVGDLPPVDRLWPQPVHDLIATQQSEADRYASAADTVIRPGVPSTETKVDPLRRTAPANDDPTEVTAQRTPDDDGDEDDVEAAWAEAIGSEPPVAGVNPAAAEASASGGAASDGSTPDTSGANGAAPGGSDGFGAGSPGPDGSGPGGPGPDGSGPSGPWADGSRAGGPGADGSGPAGFGHDGGGAGAPPPFSGLPPQPTKSGTSAGTVARVLAIVVAVVIVVGFGVFVANSIGRAVSQASGSQSTPDIDPTSDSPSPEPSPTSESPSPSPTARDGDTLDDADLDDTPMEPEQFFPELADYELPAYGVRSNCDKASTGGEGATTDLVNRYDCDRMLTADYLDKDDGLMASVMVFAMPTADDAESVKDEMKAGTDAFNELNHFCPQTGTGSSLCDGSDPSTWVYRRTFHRYMMVVELFELDGSDTKKTDALATFAVAVMDGIEEQIPTIR